MNQTRKIRKDVNSTSQFNNRNQLQNKVNQKKANDSNVSKINSNSGKNVANSGKTNVNTNTGKNNTIPGKSNTIPGKVNTNSGKSNTNPGKSNPNSSVKSSVTTKSTKANSIAKSKIETNVTKKVTNSVSVNKSQNLQNSQTLQVTDSKRNLFEKNTKTNETKKLIDCSDEVNNTINPLLESYDYKDRNKFTYNESTAAEPPSISEHEVDISDPILNENHSLQEEDDYNYASDDFESEYASDFEEPSIENSEINSENKDEFSDESNESEAVSSTEELPTKSQSKSLTKETPQSYETITAESTSSKPSSREPISSEPIQQKGSNQLKRPVISQRIIDLSEIIKLNTVDYNIFDNAPINYDVFMQLFGRKNRKQVYIQSKEMMEQETQTESILMSEKSSETSDGCSNSQGSASEVNPFSLLSYLQKASPKLLSLIEFESDSVREGKNKLQIPNECKQFCRKFYKLSDTQFVKTSTINLIFCDSHYLFAVQNVSKLKGCTEKSVISLWLNCNTRSPEITLIARSHVQCLTHLNSVVIAGMIDGSIALWDLKESKHYHKQVTVEQTNYILKTSSYSTAGTALNVHQNRVVSLEMVSSLNFESNDRIASIDENGLLTLWIIVDTFQKEVSFSENAEGMMPGSRLKLNKVWTFSFFNKKSTEGVVTMKCKDESTFIVGLDTGLVLKYSTFEPEKKLTYKPSDLDLQLTPVTSICVHPFDSTFLVSYKAGYICHFSFERNALMSFFSPKNIMDPIDIYWFHQSCNSFVVLESNGYFSIFNSKDESGNALLEYKNQSSRYTCLSPFKMRDHDCLAFGTDSGAVEVMHFNLIDKNE